MIEKGWTREQIGRMTARDLSVLAMKVAPSEPGGGSKRKCETAEEFVALMRDQEREANSWLAP